VAGRADARPVWSMRMARTAPDCGQMLGQSPRTSLSRVVICNAPESYPPGILARREEFAFSPIIKDCKVFLGGKF